MHTDSVKLTELLNKFSKDLESKIFQIHHDWEEMKILPWNKEIWEEFYREVHTLTGSTGTYGFKDLSKMLQELEIFIKPYVQKEPSEEEYVKISGLVGKLQINRS